MAHIGVLKAFEENGIKFDMVSGTSIGSIVGGMYAAGHDTKEIFEFLREYNILSPKTLLMMKIRGMTVENLLDRVLGGTYIEDLKLPYFAVACDVASGDEVIMTSGSLSSAMAASSAIPPVFKPVLRENKLLIDGAFVNSVPCDVLKSNGADVVIGVSLTEEENNTEIKRLIDKKYPDNGVKEVNRLEKGVTAGDYIITPDLKGFNATSIFQLDEMYKRGYESAVKAMPDIIALLEKKKILKKNKKRI